MGDELTALLHDAMPLCRTLGATASAFDGAEVRLHLDHAPELCTSNGVLHGGVLMALADSAGAGVAMLNLPDGAIGTSTIESKTNLFRPVTEGTIVVTAAPVHVGRSTIVVQSDVTRADGKLASRTTQTQAVITP